MEKMTTTITSLPHEIIAEILSWLPIEYLSPLRFVCKIWLKLLTTDPHFAKLHFNRFISSNCNPSILVVNRKYKSFPEPSNFHLAIDYNKCNEAKKLEGLNFINAFSIHGICKGMVCLSIEEEVFVWNPVTNVRISIQYSPVESHSPKANSDTSFAFGCSQGTDEYKVIKLIKERGSDRQSHTHVSVYTLGVDSEWRTLEEDSSWNLSTSDSPLVNGVLHWLNIGSGVLFDGVVALDLKTEGFQVIPLPDDVNFNVPIFFPGIKELGGLLCFYCENPYEGLQIWAMNDYGVVSSWTKQFKVVKPKVSELFFDITPIGMLAHNGEYVIENGGRDLILYNPKSNLVEKLKGFGFEFKDAYSYNGSLISPRVISGAHET